MRISGGTRVFAILGNPVGHSLSPCMHNAAFGMLGLDAVYVALSCDAVRLPQLMHGLAEAGGGGNVTIPHKGAAAAAVAEMRGPLPEACNTFWAEQGVLLGDNTDVPAVLEGLHRLGAPPTRWLLVGTGGACLAVLAAARHTGAAVALRSRSTERAVAARAMADEWDIGVAGEDECEVVINCTPLGLRPDDPLPVTPFETPRVRWVLDLVYAAGETPFVRAYRERGVAASDGREILVAQGAAAFERWFPGVRPAVEVMRAAVRDRLG